MSTEFNPGGAASLNAAVKARYEANADTNAFTDAEKAKLGAVEAGATADQTGTEIVAAIDTELGQTDWKTGGGGGGSVDSVNGATGVVVLDADDIDDAATANKFATAAELSKLAAIEAGATADQTPAEIAAMVQDWRGGGNETLIAATAALEAAASAGISDGDKGDITVSGSGSSWTVEDLAINTAKLADGAVTAVKIATGGVGTNQIGGQAVANTKLANVATSTIKGRATAGTGSPEDLTAAQVRALLNVADGAEANAVDSVNGATGVVVLDADDIDDAATTNKFATAAELSKLGAVEAGATANPTAPDSDPSGVTGADAITNIMSLTQAEYDAIGTPNASTFYIITG